MEAFDLSRAILLDTAFYPPAVNTPLHDLDVLVRGGQLAEHTPLLLAEFDQHALAFLTVQIVYHHIAQGDTAGQTWMISFCSICNGGAVFSPVVDGRILHFSARGLYDAMILLADSETNSYWDHLTGQCLYGSLRGTTLPRLGNLLHVTAKQALTAHPGIRVAVSILDAEQQALAEEDDLWRQESSPEWSKRMAQTLGNEDKRLSRLDMGLGVWTAKTQRYYPMTAINAADNACLDTIDGRRLLVYVDPESSNPAAIFTDAVGGVWQRDRFYLSNGDYLSEGCLFSADGTPKRVERPLQLFSRWYAFAAKHPGCEIYGAVT